MRLVADRTQSHNLRHVNTIQSKSHIIAPTSVFRHLVIPEGIISMIKPCSSQTIAIRAPRINTYTLFAHVSRIRSAVV